MVCHESHQYIYMYIYIPPINVSIFLPAPAGSVMGNIYKYETLTICSLLELEILLNRWACRVGTVPSIRAFACFRYKKHMGHRVAHVAPNTPNIIHKIGKMSR